jgi:hypothetical protein
VIPTSNQDGRQAKNRKRGDEILKKNPLKLLSYVKKLIIMLIQFKFVHFLAYNKAVLAI